MADIRQTIVNPGSGIQGSTFGMSGVLIPYPPDLQDGSYIIPLPGGDRLILTIDTWDATGTGGTVTSISAGTGITLTPDPIVTTGTVAISNTAVTAGTYSFPINMAINAQGQITSVTSDGQDDGNNFFIGATNGFVSGSNNTFGGPGAGSALTSGNANTGFGYACLAQLDSANSNTGFGRQALFSITTQSSNTAVGNFSLELLDTGSGLNTALGAASGANQLSYNNCMFLGYGADASVNNLTNAIAIGYLASVAVDNGLVLGNDNYVGVGISSPAYTLDLAQVNSFCGLRLATSGTPATPGNANDIVIFNNAGLPYWLDTGGTLHPFGSGGGSVTSITAGTGITCTPNPITTTGTVALTVPVSLANGGTNASLTASNGGIFYSTATAGAILSGTATANQVILSGASTSPSWSTATYPPTTTINQILYSSATNTVTGLATTNRAVLTTSSTGVPVLTALSTNGQLIIGSTAGAPAAATLTAGTGVTITNASNSITVAITNTGVTAATYQFPQLAINAQGQITTASSLGISDSVNGNLFLGVATGNLTLSGQNNTAVGQTSLPIVTTGGFNTACGYGTLLVNTTGASNSAIGFLALSTNVSGGFNTAIGGGSLTQLASTSNNTAIGYNSGANRAAYNNCTFLGYGADASVNNLTNAGAIGYQASTAVNNSLVLGSGAFVGINQSSPIYTLDLANISSRCGARFAASVATPATPANTNDVVIFNNAGAPSWVDTSGVVHVFSTTTGTVTSVSGTANRITSTGGATPVIDISASYVGQSSITTLGTITTGTWTGSVIDLAHGGTNANLTASNGGIFYSTATAGAILAGTATTRQMLQSGTSAAPAWSTATWPATTTVSQILYSSATNTVTGLATANNSVLVTDGSGVPSLSTILPAHTVKATSTTAFVVEDATPTVYFTVDTSTPLITAGANTTVNGKGTVNVYASIAAGTAGTLTMDGNNTTGSGTVSILGGNNSTTPLSNNTVTVAGGGSNGGTLTLQGGTSATATNNSITCASTVTFQKGQIVERTATAVSYSALTTDYIVAVTSTSAARTITLPAAAAGNSGQTYIVKDESGACNTNNISVVVSGGGNIDGIATFVMSQAYASFSFYSNGTQWFSC